MLSKQAKIRNVAKKVLKDLSNHVRKKEASWSLAHKAVRVINVHFLTLFETLFQNFAFQSDFFALFMVQGLGFQKCTFQHFLKHFFRISHFKVTFQHFLGFRVQDFKMHFLALSDARFQNFAFQSALFSTFYGLGFRISKCTF